jgi:dihydropteroate synthase
MGVLNLTPDSFYDGGAYSIQTEAGMARIVETALAMQKEGADMIDVGGESSRPGAQPLSADEECSRIIPVIQKLAQTLNIPISVDTYKSEVAREAIGAGATMVNDISGFHFDPKLADVCAGQQVPAILMHIRQKPSHMSWSFKEEATYQDIFQEISDYFTHSLKLAQKAGVPFTILDVGFGFGKNVEDNYRLIKHLDAFAHFNKPILAGLSRKSFIGAALADDPDAIPPPGERLYGTIAANTLALKSGAHILRVHDVKAAVDAKKVVEAFERSGQLTGTKDQQSDD